MTQLKLSNILLKCINEIGDYFEYAYTSEEDKKYVMRKIEDMTSRLSSLKDGCKTAAAVSLQEHIDTHHNGNKSAYGLTVDVSPTQVTRWINNGAVIVDGVIKCDVITKTKKGEMK